MDAKHCVKAHISQPVKQNVEVEVNGGWRFRHSIAFAVALATFFVYLPALRNDFVTWDDGTYVFNNPHLHSLDIGFLKWAFSSFYAGNWHPLTWISHAVDYAVWGLNPLGHHLTNILLHTVNSFVVVFLIMRLLDMLKQTTAKKARLPEFLTERKTFITAGVSGLLFGLHPLHVESVAWVAERKDLLCAFFFILSIITYTNYVRDRDSRTGQLKPSSPFFNKQYFLTALFFTLALLSKPMAVTLPIVLLILDWHPFQRMSSLNAIKHLLVEKLPFFALSLGSSILTMMAQSAAMASLEANPWSMRGFVAAKALIAYLWNMIWPLHLIPFYPYPIEEDIFSFEYIAAIALVIGITIAVVVMGKTRKFLTAAWYYYVVTLIPVLGIVQVGGQLMADRYTYLPSLGPFFLVGLAAALIVEKVYAIKKVRVLFGAFSAMAVVILIGSLSYLTVKQIGIWKDGIVLWSYVIEREPHRVPFAYQYRGLAFQRKGQLDNALQDYDKAIILNPSDYKAFVSRGLFFQETGKLDKAREDYDAAIAVNPNYSAAYDNRGVLLCHIGLSDKAMDDFNHSITIDPRSAKTYNNRGIAYSLVGKYENALEDFNSAISLDQDYAKAYYGRGNLYLSIGKKELALADFQKACNLGHVAGCNALR